MLVVHLCGFGDLRGATYHFARAVLHGEARSGAKNRIFFMRGNARGGGRLRFWSRRGADGIGAVCARKGGRSPEKVEGAVCAPDGL